MKKSPVQKNRKRKGLTAEMLYRLNVATSVSIAPNERKVAYTVEQMDKEDRKYYTNIHMVDLPTGKPYQFTHGKQTDGQAVWSPDSSQIAFVSTRDKKTGIYVMPSTGGAEEKLVEIDGAISSLQWTPDGTNLLFNLRYNDSHFISDKKKKKEQPVFRHITRLFFRLDGLGYLPKDKFQIFALDVNSRKLRKITKGNRDNREPVVSPDGKWVAYISNRARQEDLEYLRDDLFLIPFRGGKERKIPTPAGPIWGAKFHPSGKWLAYIGHDNPVDAWGSTNYHIWKVGVSGRPKAVDLMPSFDRTVFDESITDLGDFHTTPSLYFSGDGKKMFFASSDTGATNLFSLSIRGGKPERIFKGKCHIKGFSIAGKGRTAALIWADLNNPGDIITCPATYGAEQKTTRLTDLNNWLRKEVKLGRTRDVMFKSFDGTKVQGFLLTPPDFNANRKYTAILQIHGGPQAQYAFSFFHEMQYLAAKGYVVFYTNPRGGAGRGETWSRAIANEWGDLDYKDCMAAADYMEKLPYVNRRRIGVTGGSYGGYMTNWMICHTNRFKAAVTQRSVVDLFSFNGSSDIGFTGKREFGGYPWTNPEGYKRMSPITHFRNVKTPVLIIHSEQDLRCNIEQADQMFVMLKTLGKKVEMVRFPEEPHGLSRHGRPDRREARLKWISDWFKKYL